MIITALTAAATAKWLTAAKIIAAAGSGLLSAGPIINSKIKKRHRRSDDELGRDSTDNEKSAASFQCMQNILLSDAVNCADSVSGVYVLRLDGRVMKCGRAAYNKGSFCGMVWRLRQYYALNYDDRSRAGDHWSVNADNKDRITVSWQCCPVSRCHELEYKLFKKYGKGPWAQRAPHACTDDSWELLI